MVFTYKCSICGQKLTDASGHWSISHTDHGFNHNASVRMRVCSCCNDETLKLVSELRKKKMAKEAD